MKIAVAAMEDTVSRHFGHCQHFLFFEAENGEIVDVETVPNPGHRPGFLPNFLADRGANVIIAGGMGGNAAEIFKSRNVDVIMGAEGDARDAAERYLSGDLHSTGSICTHHEHDHGCH